MCLLHSCHTNGGAIPCVPGLVVRRSHRRMVLPQRQDDRNDFHAILFAKHLEIYNCNLRAG